MTALKLAPMGAETALEHLISEGRMIVTPALAQRIIEERNYSRQRRTYASHIALFAEKLRRGEFLPGHQMWFGLLDGRLHLVDGQHRAHGVVQAGVPAEFQIAIFPVRTMDELHELYISFDRINRPRTLAEVLNALNVSDAYGVSKSVSASVWKAALLLHFNFNPPHHTADPVAVRDDTERARYAKPYWDAAAKFEGMIQAAPTWLRRRLCQPQVLAVGLVTVQHQAEMAGVFWRGLAENDGLRRGDPRHTLIAALGDRTFKQHDNTGARLAALAWNAFYEHRSVGILKAAAGTAVRIAGTPFSGRAA